MKKILLSAVLATAIVMGVNADEYRHISPITLQLIEFNLDTMRNVTNGNLDLYLTHLGSLQSDLERQGKDIGEAQKNLQSEKKLYDTQVAFLKGRQAMVKNEKKYYVLKKNAEAFNDFMDRMMKSPSVLSMKASREDDKTFEEEKKNDGSV